MREVKRPPGPKNPLLLGHVRKFRRDPLNFLTRMANEFGDVVYFKLANQHAYLVNDPELIQDILVTQQKNFRKSRILQRAKVLLGEGLLTAEGDFHLRQRRLVQPAFHRDRLQAYAAMMVDAAEKTSTRWQDRQEIDVHREMMRLTLAIVGKTLFSADVEEESAAIGEALTAVLSLFDIALLPFSDLMIRLPLPASKRFQNAKALLDSTIYRMIEERRRSGVDAGDLLSMLILAMDEQGTGGMTDQQVRDEALTLFLAGHETTANALTWTWYLLARNPHVEEHMRQELAQFSSEHHFAFEDLGRLSYTQAVFAEAMRLYPPAWAVGRMSLKDVIVGDYELPRGSIVIMSPYVMHRTVRYWPDPEVFRPERFLGSAGERRPKFSYFPFGGGSRICIGERFAWMEGTLLLAILARHWRLELAPNQTVEPHAQITLRPRDGIKMVFNAVPHNSFAGIAD